MPSVSLPLTRGCVHKPGAIHRDSCTASRAAGQRGSSNSALSCRCRQYSSLRLPLMYSHPYSQITVETEFDNPIYETGVSGPSALQKAPPCPQHGRKRELLSSPASSLPKPLASRVLGGVNFIHQWLQPSWGHQGVAVAELHSAGSCGAATAHGQRETYLPVRKTSQGTHL